MCFKPVDLQDLRVRRLCLPQQLCGPGIVYSILIVFLCTLLLVYTVLLVHSVLCVQYPVQYTVYTVQYTVYTVQYTVYTVQYTVGDSPQICTKGHWSMLNLKKNIRVQILAVGQQFFITNSEETIGSPNFW